MQDQIGLRDQLAGFVPDQIINRFDPHGVGTTHALVFPPIPILARTSIIEAFVFGVSGRFSIEGIATLLTA